MNIAIITILLPYPLDSGGAQAQYNMIEELRNIHHISLIYPENQHNSKAAMLTLKEKWPEVSFHPYPYWKQLSHPHFLLSKVERAIKLALCKRSNAFQIERVLKPYGYDLTRHFVSFINTVLRDNSVELAQVEFYPYLGIVSHLPKDIKRVFIHHEIGYIRKERTLQGLHPTATDLAFAAKAKAEEIALLNQYDRVVTLTETDRETLSRDGVTSSILVSPAGVSTQVMPYHEWNHTLVFVGGSGHSPNVEGMEWLTKQVFPLIHWEDFPGITFKIIGKGWHEGQLPHYQGLNIQCLGFVEDLPTEAYGGIMVVPILSGSGMRMKILEGAAMSMPIVTTQVGMEGIDMADGLSCLIEDTPQAFTQALTQLFTDRALREKIGTGANQVFQQRYSIQVLAERRNQVYNF